MQHSLQYDNAAQHVTAQPWPERVIQDVVEDVYNQASHLIKATQNSQQQDVATSFMVITQLKAYYTNFLNADLSLLPKFYIANIEFHDPVHSIKGRKALARYFEKTRSSLKQCTFSYFDEFQNTENTFLSWEMHYSHPKLSGGAPLRLTGANHFKVKNNLVVFHQDYYDLGKMLYEKFPLIGRCVRSLKKRV